MSVVSRLSCPKLQLKTKLLEGGKNGCICSVLNSDLNSFDFSGLPETVQIIFFAQESNGIGLLEIFGCSDSVKHFVLSNK